MTKWKSFLLVLFVHSFFLFQATKRPPVITPKIAHKIKVQTIIHTPSPPKPPVVTQVKKPAPKPTPPPLPVPVKKVIPKKIIAKNPEKPKNTIDIAPPTPIKQLNLDSEQDPGALAALIAVMQETLSLPEVGKVKIELTITSQGKVKHLKVLSSESELNREYLETHLHELIFPVREKGLFQHDDQTFVFAFHSVT